MYQKTTSKPLPVRTGLAGLGPGRSVPQLESLSATLQRAPSVTNLEKLQVAANRLPAITNLKKLQIAANASAQRRVKVNDVPIKEKPAGVFILGPAPVDLNTQERGRARDALTRRYETLPEFRDHVAGNPVPVGLAGTDTIRWFRIEHLPGGNDPKFFVLGENHGDTNYREIVRASNQTGPVLGEGGMNSVGPMEPGKALEADQQVVGGSIPLAQEVTAENLIAKVYFPAAMLRKRIEEVLAKNAPTQGNFASANNKRLAFFGRFTRLRDRINAYDNGAFVATLGAAITAYDAVAATPLTDDASLRANLALLSPLTGAMFIAAKAEEAKGGVERAPRQGLFDKSKEVDEATYGGDTGRLVKASYYRNQAMYQAIVKANNAQNFIMGGFGDNHVKALQPFLPAAIPVITYTEFTSGSHAGVTIHDPDQP